MADISGGAELSAYRQHHGPSVPGNVVECRPPCAAVVCRSKRGQPLHGRFMYTYRTRSVCGICCKSHGGRLNDYSATEVMAEGSMTVNIYIVRFACHCLYIAPT